MGFTIIINSFFFLRDMTVIGISKLKDINTYLMQQKAHLADLQTEVAELEELAKTGLDLSVYTKNNRNEVKNRYLSQDFSRATDVSLEKSVSENRYNGHFALLSAYFSFPVQTSAGEKRVYCSDNCLDLSSVVTALFRLKKDSFEYNVYHNMGLFTFSIYSNRRTPADLIEKARKLVEAVYDKYPCQGIEGNLKEAEALQQQPAFRELFFN